MQDQLSLRLHALADPTRRGILSRLALGEATVTELAQPFGMSQPSISRHLKVLQEAGLIETSREAQARPRRLRPDALQDVQAWLDTLRNLWSDSFDRLGDHLNNVAGNLEENGK